MDLVSIIMSTYKEPLSWIQKSVLSIQNQTYRNIELIIVLDNPDNEEVTLYLEEVCNEDDRVRIIKNKKNLGLVKSLNKAINICKGDYIARMDADDISIDCRIEKQLAFLKNRHLDIVGTAFSDFASENDDLKMRINPRRPFACQRVLRFKNCVVHPSWLLKKEVYQRLNGYREIKACEDYDFLVRAVLKGFKIGNMPEMMLLYRNNPNSISHKDKWNQIVIMELIGKEYRRGKELSFDEYMRYMTSDMMEKDIQEIQNNYAIDKSARDYIGIKKIIHITKKMFNSVSYRSDKLRNQYIKLQFGLDKLVDMFIG